MKFAVITGKTIHRLIHEDVAGCVEIVKETYLAGHREEVVCPRSYFLRFPDRPDARIIALPAHLGGEKSVSGIKWIASYPANIREGIPRASAVLILNRADNGYPFACLEASIISAARTAASAVAAAELLGGGGRKVRTLGILGTGLIARYVYQFLLRLDWEVERVLLCDANPAESARFQGSVCDAGRHAEIAVAPDASSLFRESDLIVLATSAGTPHIHDPGLLAHRPVVLHLSLRDLAPELILTSQNVVDDVGHVMTANTSVHLAEQQSGNRSFITGTFAEVLLGERAIDRSRPIVFSPFGMGTLDLAVGRWVYERAERAGESIGIEDFFFEMER